MRHGATQAEQLLWERLRDRRLGNLKFRRQHTIDRFIVDFYCADARLAIEVDGPVHEGTVDEDRARDGVLANLGIEVIRFQNDDVMRDPEAVASMILERALR